MNAAILVALIAGACSFATSALTGLCTWLVTRSKAKIAQPADFMTALAAYQRAVQEGAEGVMKDLRDQVESLQKEVDLLKVEHAACLKENIQLRQGFESLSSILRRHGIDIRSAAPPGGWMVAEGDRVTTYSPTLSDQPTDGLTTRSLT